MRPEYLEARQGGWLPSVFGAGQALMVEVYAHTQPYIRGQDDTLAMTAQWGIFFTLFGGLLLKTKVPSGDGYEGALGSMLVLVNGAVFAVAVFAFLYLVCQPKQGKTTADEPDSSPENRTHSNPMVQTAAAAGQSYAATAHATQGDDSEPRPTAQL